MKSHSVATDTGRGKRVTRTQRRAMERAEKRQRTRQSGRFAGLPMATLIGGLVTILAVLTIITVGLLRSYASTSSRGGLTDAQALNPQPALLAVGQQAPDFTLQDTAGKSYSLAAQRGHPVLLEFFAVWCPVCQGEAPTIAQLTQNYVPKGVRVWSVLASPYSRNYDISGGSDLSLATSADLAWYARSFNVRHPQLVDPKFNTVNQYGVNAYPGIYVVNRKGAITYAAVGHQDYAKLSAALNRALSA